MKKEKITCIICPIGCKIFFEKEGSKVNILEGNKCKKGCEYAIHEALNPSRMLTSSVLVKNGTWPLVSVKSSKSVPKEKIFEALEIIKNKSVQAPVYIGDIIIKNILNTDINIIATKNVSKK